MPRYNKPFLTYEEQLDLLADRGIHIEDRTKALKDLQRLGYYRLSAYWYPYRIRPTDHREGIDTPHDNFASGLAFEDVVQVCEFDRQLRLMIWPAIEAVEIAIRVSVAYQMGQYGAYAYVDPKHLSSGAIAASPANPALSQLQSFEQRLQRAVGSSKESFAKHFREKYEGTLPVWAAIELWDFGTLSSYYQIMKMDDRAAVARASGLQSARLLGSWLESINVLRNICAHHGRLNRRHLALAPRIPKPATSVEFAHLYPLDDEIRHSLYPLLCVLSYLSKRINGHTNWHDQLIMGVGQIARLRLCRLQDYGFPTTWSEQSLWQSE